MTFLKRLWARVLRLPRLYSIGGAVIIVAALAIGIHLATRAAPAPATPPQVPRVSVSAVSDLAAQSDPLALTGKVASLNQATLLAQASGELVSLSKQIGDTVAAGQVIGQLDSSSQQAAVTQAQGAYNAAVATGQTNSLPETDTEARQAYLSAYTTLDSALHTDVDALFGDPTPYGPQLLIADPSGDPQRLSGQRRAIQEQMDTWQADLSKASTSDPKTLINQAYATTQAVSSFTVTLADAANGTGSGASATQLADLAAARSSIDGLLSTLSAAQDTYRSKSVGATSLTDANIQQALGALDAAKANLAKTVIRSPISGTIVSLPVNQGDFISLNQEVAAVSNPHALEIDTYVTPDDAHTISVGGAVTIDGNISGVIISIAPALDPTTGKIEVKIGITGSQNTLTDGDTVSVALTRASAAPVGQVPDSGGTITIPIVAAKITPDGAAVFTVASSTLVAQPVTLGTILGDRVVVVSGLTPSMQIVTDARGLSNGETVTLNNP